MLYTALCVAQLVIGLLMFCFGIADRTAIQVQYSFLMLPIWIGILAGLTGLFGIIMGYRSKRQGYPNINMAAGIRAINKLCVGLSFLLFLLYSFQLSHISWINAYNAAIDKLPVDDPDRKKYGKIIADGRTPIDVATNDATIQGILAVIMVLCLAEIFVGCWMAMLVKNQMMIGSQNRQQDTRQQFDNQAFYPHPSHVTAPQHAPPQYSMASHVTAPEQAPPQQVPYGGPEPKV